MPALRPFGQRWQLLWRWMLLLLPAPRRAPAASRAYRTDWANRAFQRHYRRNRRHGCDRPNRTYAGATGATGASPVFSIGEVITAEPGVPASVTITGNPFNAYLKLCHPARRYGRNRADWIRVLRALLGRLTYGRYGRYRADRTYGCYGCYGRYWADRTYGCYRRYWADWTYGIRWG